MTPSLVKYQFLADERARNVTLRKRKTSLLKKMSELKLLCDVDCSLVMYEKDETRADVWPSFSEALRLIQRFQNSTMLGARSMVDHKSFLQTSILKMNKHLEKEQRKNIKRLMIRCALDESALDQNDQVDLEGLPNALKNEIEFLDLMIKNASKNASEKGKEKLV